MTHAQRLSKAVAAINAQGALLVFPLNNRKEPRSLWSELHPRTKMRWEWDAGGDNRVAHLWHLREVLSRSRKVVYTKWYQNRATLFSFEVFVNLLAFFASAEQAANLEMTSGQILEFLQQDSPLSTKQVKAAAELEGRSLESTYNRAMKPLWQNLMIVAFGEFEDSSFPSLGIGATEVMFEELWAEGRQIERADAENFLVKKLGTENLFYKFAVKVRKTRAFPLENPAHQDISVNSEEN